MKLLPLLALAAAMLSGTAHSQAQAQAQAHTQAAPDISGVWRLAGAFQSELRTTDDKAPPLLPKALATYRQRQAALSKGDHAFDNASTICVSPGMPRMVQLPYPFQIIQGSRYMLFLFEWNGRRRLIDMSGAAPEPPDLFYMGTSAGKVVGDAVVAETRGLIDTSLLDASGMPHSDQLKLTERYTLADNGATLVDEITIEDPATFSKSWTTRLTFQRQSAGTEIQEDVCRERVTKGGTAFEYDKFN